MPAGDQWKLQSTDHIWDLGMKCVDGIGASVCLAQGVKNVMLLCGIGVGGDAGACGTAL